MVDLQLLWHIRLKAYLLICISKRTDVIDGVQDAVRWLNDQIKFLEDRIGLDFNGESGVSDGT